MRNFILLAFAIVSTNCFAQTNGITKDNITFIYYPGFPEGSSAWNSIGYNTKHNSVFAGITNHKDKVAIYEYDPGKDSMLLKGFIDELMNLRKFQWQAKVHTKFVPDNEGNVYAATDGGESREEYLMDHPHGYAGGFFIKWNGAEQKLQNLGMGMQYESIKDVDIDLSTGNLYAVSYPQVHFLVYNPAKNNLKDLGRLGSGHVPRVLFTDEWGNCYYTDWRQRLVKYEKSEEKLIFAKESLPAFPGTPGEHIITGITAYAKDKKNGVIYFVTYGAKVIAFYPQEKGFGKVKDLGGVMQVEGKPSWNYYVPNLNVGDNGKLYYIIGGHGIYAKKGYALFVELDPVSGTRKVIYEYPDTELVEATGSDTKDKDGNIYFAGKKEAPPEQRNRANVLSEAGDSPTIPFLIKFNPEKSVNR
jgi:hypothetical protein